jgi:anti-anti-sigma factor
VNIQVQQVGAVSVIKPEGPLTREDVEAFKEHLLAVIHTHLGRAVVDISAIPYVDSQGLEGLVDVTEQLARSGKVLKLCGANETLRQVIDLTGLSAQFEQFEDVHKAVRSFL